MDGPCVAGLITASLVFTHVDFHHCCYPTYPTLGGFAGDTVVKSLLDNVGDVRDVGPISGSGRSPGGGHGNPLQDSCLEHPTDRGAWWATVHGVT